MKLFDCETVNDVTFEVGNLETGIEYISGNRTMFAAHSQVFKQMLFGPMIDEKSRKSRIIILNDMKGDGDQNPIYYAMETLAMWNIMVDKPARESRLDCVNMGMIDQVEWFFK